MERARSGGLSFLLALTGLLPAPPGPPALKGGLHPIYPGDRTFLIRFLTTSGATCLTRKKKGERFLFVRTDPGEKWPGLQFHPPGRAWDLSDQLALAVRIRNEGSQPARFYLRADSLRKGRKETYIQTHRLLGPGEEGLVPLLLKPYYPAGKGLSFPGMLGKPFFSADFDPSWITRILVFTTGPEKRRRFAVLDLGSVPKAGIRDRLPPPHRFFPLLDRFGQYLHREWPGKTGSAEELRRLPGEERRDLDSHPPPAGRDPYGGWALGPRLKATGAFRTAKWKRKWWLVDPEGRLFWSFGVDCVGPVAATPLDERRFLFSFLPPRESPGGRFYGRGSWAPRGFYRGKGPFETFNFLGWNLFRKYGGSWRADFADSCRRRLRSWGFNTLGNWSDPFVAEKGRIPYVRGIHFPSPRIEGSSGFWGKFPDPFHPDFRKNLRLRLEREKNGSARDPWCIGYFVHNELTWGGRTTLAEAAMKSPDSQPAKRALLDFLQEKYSSIDALNRAWKTRFASWKALASSRRIPPGGRPLPDLARFCRRIYETYFRVVREEIDRAAPGRLYLGCRFSTANDEAVRAAARFCQVLSFNWYVDTPAGKALPSGVDKPVLIGEFHFGALDRGLFHPGLRPAVNQAHRARLFRNYLEAALRSPFIVGAHWFQFHDEPTTGRFDGENFQIGLVDICDRPYPEMIRAARLVGRELYRLRADE